MTTLAALLAAAALALSLLALTQSAKRHAATARRLARLNRQTALLRALLAHRIAAAHRRPDNRFVPELRAQHGEDAFLLALFDDRTDGFFIEAGAYDGYTYANTYALEAVGWTGLLVEPLPDRVNAARRCRPASRVVHAALTAPGAPSTVAIARGASGPHASDLGSSLAPTQTRDTIDVPAVTLDELLSGIDRPIDVLVLDLEGAEPQALRGLDLQRRAPRVVLLEDDPAATNHPAADALAAHGYHTAGFIAVNRVLVHADEHALLERARGLLHDPLLDIHQPGSPPDNTTR